MLVDVVTAQAPWSNAGGGRWRNSSCILQLVGLETVLRPVAIVVLALLWGVAAGYLLQLGGVIGWAVLVKPRTEFSRQGPVLGTAAECGCRVGSEAAQGHCSGSLVQWG